jgi:hypothetical protein
MLVLGQHMSRGQARGADLMMLVLDHRMSHG